MSPGAGLNSLRYACCADEMAIRVASPDVISRGDSMLVICARTTVLAAFIFAARQICSRCVGVRGGHRDRPRRERRRRAGGALTLRLLYLSHKRTGRGSGLQSRVTGDRAERDDDARAHNGALTIGAVRVQ